ncbi:hypothetical protein AB0A74_27500 [Saccharothrix sp. NPDC042600]|uniref:hypothetical protein n=1 Tax=Saccharothrix TaxID=2071 RepID=UPI0033C73433|nr:hypothetical protein GCM10017745_32580 [Saccharothrix mutabilis subsp. capreolus]
MRRLIAAPAVVALVLATTAAASPSIVDPRNGGLPCAATLHSHPDRLAVRVVEPGPEQTVDFALWPREAPGERVERPGVAVNPAGTAWTSMPGTFGHGRSYAWQARLTGMPWTPECHFTVDTLAPPHPTVTSPNYPPASSGPAPADQPGTFVLDGGGDPDVAGFEYGFQEETTGRRCEVQAYGDLVCADPFDHPGTVRAGTPGGRVEVLVHPPGGFARLFVRSVDAGGLRSEAVVYEFIT